MTTADGRFKPHETTKVSFLENERRWIPVLWTPFKIWRFLRVLEFHTWISGFSPSSPEAIRSPDSLETATEMISYVCSR